MCSAYLRRDRYTQITTADSARAHEPHWSPRIAQLVHRGVEGDVKPSAMSSEETSEETDAAVDGATEKAAPSVDAPAKGNHAHIARCGSRQKIRRKHAPDISVLCATAVDGAVGSKALSV